MPEGKVIKRKFSESDVSSSETNDQSDDEEFLPTSSGKSTKNGIKTPKRSAAKKSKQIGSDESDSDAKPALKSHQKKTLVNKSLQNKTVRADEKCMYQISRKLPKEAVKKNKHVEKPKAIKADSSDSEDEPSDFLQKKSNDKSAQNNRSSGKEECKPISKMNGSSKRNDHELGNDSMSDSSAQTECLPSKRLKYEENSERNSESSDEDKPITKLVPKVEEMSENDFTVPRCVVVDIKSKMDIEDSSKSSNRSSTSYGKEDSDKKNVSDPEQTSKEDKADMMSIITLSSDCETLPRCSPKLSKSRQYEGEISKERRDNSPGEDDLNDKIADLRTKGSSKKEPEQSSSSDDESLARKSKTSLYRSKMKKRKPIQLKESRQDESSDEKEFVDKIAETLGSKKAPKGSLKSNDSEEELSDVSKKFSIEQPEVSENESRHIENGHDTSSDEDESLTKIAKSSGKSGKALVPSDDSSDEDFTIKNRKNTTSKSQSSLKAPKEISKLAEENHDASSDEDEPLTKIAKSKKGSLKSNDSEEELSDISKEFSIEQPEVSENESRHIENGHDTSSDEDEPLTKIAKSSGKSGKALVPSDDSSDEDFTIKNKKNTTSKSQNRLKALKKKSKLTEENHDASSDEDEPLTKIAKSKKGSILSNDSEEELSDVPKEFSDEHSKENSHDTSSDEDAPLTKLAKSSGKSGKALVPSDNSSDEDFTIKNRKNTTSKSQSSLKAPKEKSKLTEENHDASSDEDEPLSKVAKMNGKSKKTIVSSSDSNDESIAVKKIKKKTSEKSQRSKKPQKKSSRSNMERDSATSDEESKPLSKIAKKSKATIEDQKIERLKKYLRASGIHIQNYSKLFQDCKTIKDKVEKLLNTLHLNGLKGTPTLEKCKKLRKKNERKKEIAELDTSNIIKTEGRPKRHAAVPTPTNISDSPVKKTFSRLKDIIDTDESD